MRRSVGSAVVMMMLAGLVRPAWSACGDDLPARWRLEATVRDQRVVFAPRGGPIPLGRLFAIDVVVCPAPGAQTVTQLRVDADMPAHKHGMNYRTTVKPLGDARFGVEGLMFHMPGRWRFLFEIDAAGQALRAEREVELQ